MIVYFEDGKLIDDFLYSLTGEELIKIDAGMGYSNCRKKLRYINDNYPFDTRVYTNSLDAFSNAWCWDEEVNKPQIYIRKNDDVYGGEWVNITYLTDRELRRGMSLEKLYMNGEFSSVAT